jgi:hypothetical protein
MVDQNGDTWHIDRNHADRHQLGRDVTVTSVSIHLFGEDCTTSYGTVCHLVSDVSNTYWRPLTWRISEIRRIMKYSVVHSKLWTAAPHEFVPYFEEAVPEFQTTTCDAAVSAQFWQARKPYRFHIDSLANASWSWRKLWQIVLWLYRNTLQFRAGVGGPMSYSSTETSGGSTIFSGLTWPVRLSAKMMERSCQSSCLCGNISPQ